VNDNGNITIETNIFDFDRDIYGNIIKVELIQKIRGEKKFAGIEELKKQMSNDIDAAKKIIADSKLVK
jgi:riboflavin kinase / FMN adenylyltransferase